MSDRFIQSPKVAESVLGDEAVLLHLELGIYFGVDIVGKFIWSCLSEPHTFQMVVAKVIEEFDGLPEAFEEELAAYWDSLVAAGLIIEST